MSIFWIIFEIFLNGFDAAFFMSFSTIKLGVKGWVKKRDIILCWLFLVLAFSIINFSTTFSLISMYLFPVLILCYVFIFIKGRFLIRLFWVILPFVFMAPFETLILSFIVESFKIPFEMILQQNIYRLLFVVIIKIGETFFCFLLIGKKQFIHLKHKNLILFFILNIFCLYVAVYVLIVNPIKDIYMQVSFIIIPFLFLLLNIYNFISIKLIENKHKENLKEHTKSLQLAHQSDLLKAYENLRLFKQEILENLQAIWSNAKNHDSNLIKENILRLNQINQQLSIIQRTGNDLLDIMISMREAMAANLGISINLDTINPINNNFDLTEFNILIDELLDNAIKTLQNTSSSDFLKNINISLQTINDYFIIEMEYPYDSENYQNSIQYYNNRFKNHQINSNIQKIVEKNNGFLFIQNQDYYCTIFIKLPLSTQ